MVLTRKESTEALNHVLDNVLGRGDGTPLKNALIQNGIEGILDMGNLRQADIDTLSYTDDKNTQVPLNLGDKNIIRVFLQYVNYRTDLGAPIGDGWIAITRDDFNEYRAHLMASNAPGTSPTMSSSSTGPQRKPTSPVDTFRRGIKRDATQFPVLKDERMKDTWHHQFLNQARAQGVADILDHLYTPTTQEDKELFDEMQKFLYAVLDTTVRTDRGRAIVRSYEDTYDAQKVYTELQEYHMSSTKAKIESSTLLSYITSAKLGDGSWKGSTEGFILHWQDQVRKYENQVDKAEHFSDAQKRTMLQNAVHPEEELRQVKNNMDLEHTKTGKILTYQQYVNLLLSAAAAHDLKFATKQRQHVNQHELQLDSIFGHHDVHYNIDAYPGDLLEVYNHDRQSLSANEHRIIMPKDRWMQLPASARSVWDQLDDKAKAVILGLSSSGTSPGLKKSKQPVRFSSNTKPPVQTQQPSLRRRVNLHDISAHDLLEAYSHEFGVAEDESEDHFEDAIAEQELPDQEPEQSTLLVNAAKSSTHLQPGDIRRILSSSSSKHSQPPNKKLAAKVHITYQVSQAHSSAKTSLVDRGANGGVAGSDVRVVHQTPLNARRVDIQGIDDHQLTNVPIGTVGGVVTTQHGPVIAIMHQYALHGKGHTIHSPGQFEWHKVSIDDKSVHVGGLQRLKTLDGYIVPFAIKNGLARLDIRPYTDHEWDTLPHVILTSEEDWDPTVLDFEHDEDDWYDAVSELEGNPHANLFDEFGNYRRRVLVQELQFLDAYELEQHDDTAPPPCPPRITNSHLPDFASL